MKYLGIYVILSGLLILTIVLFFNSRNMEEAEKPLAYPVASPVQSPAADNSTSLRETTVSLAKGMYKTRKILDTIEDQTGAVFVYNSKVIDDSVPILIRNNLCNVKLLQALKVIFQDKPIRWKFSKDAIHLNPIR